MASLRDRRWPWRRLLAIVVALLILGAAPAWSFWRSTQTVPGVALNTGTLDLQVNGADPFTAFSSLSFDTMVPGASTAGVLTIRNVGNVPLSYYVDAATTNADGLGLGAALVAAVTDAADVTGTAPSATCGGTPITPSATSFTSDFVGSVGTRRTLAPGESETLCIQASLPADAPASLVGATTDVTFTVHAIQVGAG